VRSAVVLATCLLAATACAGDDQRGSGSTSPSTVPTPADPGEGSGPFAVGHRELTAVDPSRGGRELPVAVWYPAEADSDGAATFYPFVGDVGVTSELSTDDATAAGGTFPLIVFSHGNGGTRTQSTFLAEALASHGFVVASPDHVGNTATDLVLGVGVSQVQSALDRPLDVSSVIDLLAERAADPADALFGHVDTSAVGVTGHSFGGLTSLASAVETDGVPAEPRVAAIAPLAPASSVIGDEALASITTPTLLVGGALDGTTPVEPEITRPASLISAPSLVTVVVDGAGHISFTDICPVAAQYKTEADAVALIVAYLDGLADEGCSDEFVEPDRVHSLTNRYVVSFFRVHLARDDAYRALLASAPGATVEVVRDGVDESGTTPDESSPDEAADAEPVSGGDRSYPTTMRVLTLRDPDRTTPAAGPMPDEDHRSLETWLWAPDAPGPFPLIVFAHGFNGHPELFGQLFGAWASHGYVVAAPQFPRTSSEAADPTAGLPDFASQPGDLAFVLDEVLDRAEPGGELDGVVDADRVGAAGLSLGGGTVYGFAYNECCRDDRVDAVEILAGADFPLPGELDLSRGPPLLVVHGTLDPAIPYATAQRLVASAGVPTWFVTLVDGLHSQPFDDLDSPYDRHVEAFTTDFWDVHLAGRSNRQAAFEADADVEGLVELEAVR
jgi:predicted dienelactone hydrolase